MRAAVNRPGTQVHHPEPARLAYADPPYPGQAKRKYGDHADFGGEVDHAELIERLCDEYDGWALSTSAQALQDVLALCPHREPGIKGRRYRAFTGVRVLSWCKTNAPPFPDSGIFGWEPVIVRAVRPPAAGLRDWIICNPESYTFRPKPADYVPGAKPAGFCRWVFDWLGARAPDSLDDLFPGSGAVAREWATFQAQGRLVAA